MGKAKENKVKKPSETSRIVRLQTDLYREFKIVCLASEIHTMSALNEVVRLWTASQKKKLGLVYNPLNSERKSK